MTQQEQRPENPIQPTPWSEQTNKDGLMMRSRTGELGQQIKERTDSSKRSSYDIVAEIFPNTIRFTANHVFDDWSQNLLKDVADKLDMEQHLEEPERRFEDRSVLFTDGTPALSLQQQFATGESVPARAIATLEWLQIYKEKKEGFYDEDDEDDEEEGLDLIQLLEKMPEEDRKQLERRVEMTYRSFLWSDEPTQALKFFEGGMVLNPDRIIPDGQLDLYKRLFAELSARYSPDRQISPHKQRDRNFFLYGEEIIVENEKTGANEILIAKRENDTITLVCKDEQGKLSWEASFPLQLPTEQITTILNDPNADFRKIRQLVPASFRRLS